MDLKELKSITWPFRFRLLEMRTGKKNVQRGKEKAHNQ